MGTNKPLKTELISAIPQKDGTSVNVALAPADAPDNIPDYGKEPPMQFQEYKDGEMGAPSLEEMRTMHTIPNRFYSIPSPEEQGGAETEILVEHASPTRRLDVPKMAIQASEKEYLRAGEHSVAMTPFKGDAETQEYQ